MSNKDTCQSCYHYKKTCSIFHEKYNFYNRTRENCINYNNDFATYYFLDLVNAFEKAKSYEQLAFSFSAFINFARNRRLDVRTTITYLLELLCSQRIVPINYRIVEHFPVFAKVVGREFDNKFTMIYSEAIPNIVYYFKSKENENFKR